MPPRRYGHIYDLISATVGDEAGETMSNPDDPRIDKMYRGDCASACVALVALWATIAFVFYKVYQVCDDSNIRIALLIGAGMLLILNSASIIALVRHYTSDKIHLYGLDLFYLDDMRAAKRRTKA